MEATERRIMAEHLAGPLTLGVVAGAYNALAWRQGRPTISAGVRWLASRTAGVEIAGAVAGLLLAHWFLQVPDAQ